jgi:hypothetical protein
MRLDFWNNPIIVSAFRVKYRRGGLSSSIVLYLALLTTGGAVLAYYQRDLPLRWWWIYFWILVGLQFAVSAIMALSATSASIQAEVVNRTLDFQRTTALSPGQIILGKLLGEPALAYLLAIGTLPLAFWCWMMGVPGLDLVAWFLLYVLLATNTLMFGAIGLLHSLEPGSGKSGQRGVGGARLLPTLLIVVGNLAAGMTAAIGTAALAVPWAALLLGLLTPVPVLAGLIGPGHSPWEYGLSFCGVEVPFLLVTPLAQLIVAALCFESMSRRLVHPGNPPWSKLLAYETLALADVLTAAALFDPGLKPGARVATFCIIHLVLSLWLMTGVTPWREGLLSWVWRFRGRRARLWDWWLGDRSENTLFLLTCAAIGLAVGALGVVVPAGPAEGWKPVVAAGPAITCALAETTVLLLSLGTVYQWLVFIGGRYGKTAFILLLLLVDVLPHSLGQYYDWPWLLSLSPTANMVRWFEPTLSPPVEPLLLVLAYGAVLLLAWWSLRGRVRRLERAVDRKLEQMGVVREAASK